MSAQCAENFSIFIVDINITIADMQWGLLKEQGANLGASLHCNFCGGGATQEDALRCTGLHWDGARR